MKLSVKAFGVSCALLWGIGLFLITWWIILWEGTSSGSICLERVYIGYCVSPVGSLVGLAWGLVDGLIAGLIFAWLYNRMVDVCTDKQVVG